MLSPKHCWAVAAEALPFQKWNPTPTGWARGLTFSALFQSQRGGEPRRFNFHASRQLTAVSFGEFTLNTPLYVTSLNFAAHV